MRTPLTSSIVRASVFIILMFSVSMTTALAQSSVAPGDSIQAVVTAASDGAIITIKSGIHRQQSITPKNGQTFVGETGAILSGAKVLTGWVQSGASWYVTGQTQQGPVNGMNCKPTAPRCSNPEDLFINNIPMKAVAVLTDGKPGSWFFDYVADRIYIWNNPTGQMVETSVTPQAFGGSAIGVTITNLVIEKYASPTQSQAVLLGTGWTIQNSELRFNHFAAINTGGNSAIRGNHIHDNGAFGLNGAGGGIVVENNEIDHNNVDGYDYYWGAGGSKWVYTDGLIVRGNFSHHNDGPGLWTDINNINTLYENNTVEDNTGGGIFHELSYAAVIRNNTARRNGNDRPYPGWSTGAGIQIVDAPNVEVYGNVVEENWQGITGLDDGRADTNTQNHGAWRLTNLSVHDNTVRQLVNVGAGAGRTGLISSIGAGMFTSNNHFTSNTYQFGCFLDKPFIWSNGDATPSAWQAAGQDATGTIRGCH